MYAWITLAEWASLIFSVILIVNVFVDADNSQIRQRIVKSTYLSVFFSIAFTLGSTYALLNIDILSVPVVDFITFIYFLLLPVPYVFCLRYAQSLLYFKISDSHRLRKWFRFWIPYLVYLIFISLNFLFNHIYELTPEGEYKRGVFYQSPYALGLMYFIAIVYTLIRCRSVLGKRRITVLLMTLLISFGLVIIQFISSNIMLLGTVNTIIAVTIHLNIQNSNKDIDRRTGLLNREVLLNRIQHKINSKTDFSLYLFSLRDFKNVNERIGLYFGDFVLEEIAQNLVKIFGRVNVFRYKGDEFAVTTTGENNDINIKKAVDMFLQPFKFNGITSTVDMVYARVDYPSFGEDIKSLISAVDYSISTIKKGKNDEIAIYDIDLREKMAADLDIQARIKMSVEEQDIIVHYQPIYSVLNDSFITAEALVRMRGEGGCLIPPGRFIEIAEDTGLIIDLTYLILDKVCRDINEMKEKYGEFAMSHSVSINFPYIQFLQPDVVARVEQILDNHGISPSQIKIEITERTLISNHQTVNDVIDKLQKIGFELEVDDFGIEYSNLSLLLQVPFDILKVDRSLILEVMKSDENKEFFKNLVRGIKAINKLIIVEGIESEEQFYSIKDCGIDYFQGYYFSMPIPPDDLFKFLENKKSVDNKLII